MGDDVGIGDVDVVANRVEMQRGNIREWYVNGPLGVEQGFTLQQAPHCPGPKAITLEIEGNLTPKLQHATQDVGPTVAFVDGSNKTMVRYSDLYAKDATGKRISAWMTVNDGYVVLNIDDTGAAYPVEIDPLVWIEQAKFVASDAAAGDSFGNSVAIWGDTVLVGAPNDTIGAISRQGSVHVFERSGNLWINQQKLVANDGQSEDWFGHAVAIDGNTAIVGAYGDDDGGSGIYRGSAYVYTRGGEFGLFNKTLARLGPWSLLFRHIRSALGRYGARRFAGRCRGGKLQSGDRVCVRA